MILAWLFRFKVQALNLAFYNCMLTWKGMKLLHFGFLHDSVHVGSRVSRLAKVKRGDTGSSGASSETCKMKWIGL